MRHGDLINKYGVSYNKYGTPAIIINYIKYNDIVVEFQDEYKYQYHSSMQTFKNGELKNPYDKRLSGIGYIGVGKYCSKENGKVTDSFQTWQSMIKRCYFEKQLLRDRVYFDCIVCDEWHNFQNFAKWYEENIYECNGEEMNLDKDILIKGNRIYSPNTCVFVPKYINCLFTDSKRTRGKYPIGVDFHKQSGLFRARCSDYNHGTMKSVHLGCFNNKMDAFNAYKLYKESLIKKVANEYKEKIPIKLYNALINYKVEITD